MSRVANLSPTVSVSRGAADRGPHSAINAIARVCSCLHLLCTHINIPRYPIYNQIVDRRAISRVISTILGLSRNAGFRMLTPIIHRHGNARRGRLSTTHQNNCSHIHVSNRLCSLSRRVALRGGVGRAIRVIISHLTVHGNVQNHLTSSLRATLTLANNVTRISIVNNRYVAFDRGFTYPRRNVSVDSLSPQLFSFGGPLNTYRGYANLNAFVQISRRHVLPGQDLSVQRKTVGTDN